MLETRSAWSHAVNRSELLITHLSVRVRAYFIWQDRMRRCIPGSELDDWLKAEKLEIETVIFLGPFPRVLGA